MLRLRQWECAKREKDRQRKVGSERNARYNLSKCSSEFINNFNLSLTKWNLSIQHSPNETWFFDKHLFKHSYIVATSSSMHYYWAIRRHYGMNEFRSRLEKEKLIVEMISHRPMNGEWMRTQIITIWRHRCPCCWMCVQTSIINNNSLRNFIHRIERGKIIIKIRRIRTWKMLIPLHIGWWNVKCLRYGHIWEYNCFFHSPGLWRKESIVQPPLSSIANGRNKSGSKRRHTIFRRKWETLLWKRRKFEWEQMRCVFHSSNVRVVLLMKQKRKKFYFSPFSWIQIS